MTSQAGVDVNSADPISTDTVPTGIGPGVSLDNAEQLFLAHLPLIDRLVMRAARRQCLRPDEVDDFNSFVRLRLIEEDYAVLRKYEQRSSFDGFLAIVVLNLARDYRIRQMGKWRPSAAAKRLGTVAIQLETLVHREGFGYDEAFEMLRRNHGVDASRAELEDLAARLPPRQPRHVEDGDSLETLNDERLKPTFEDERRQVAERANQVLQSTLGALEAEDQLLLRLRFRDDLKVSRVARLLDLEQRTLYSRFTKLMGHFRQSFALAGLDRQDVLDLIGWEASILNVDYGADNPDGPDSPDGPPDSPDAQMDKSLRIATKEKMKKASSGRPWSREVRPGDSAP